MNYEEHLAVLKKAMQSKIEEIEFLAKQARATSESLDKDAEEYKRLKDVRIRREHKR